MSLLNLAYQNVALYRSEMSSHNEQMLKSCGSMSDIRKKAENEAHLKKSWLKAVEPMINLLDERTERIQLKEKSFKRGVPATDEEISEFELNVRRLVDPDITVGKYTKNDLKKYDGYKEFMNKHYRERETISFRILVAQNVRFTVNCCECGKPRCINSKNALTLREERCLRRLLEKYTCGSVITPVGDGLQGVVFVGCCCKCAAQLLLNWQTIQQPTSHAKICVVTVQTTSKRC